MLRIFTFLVTFGMYKSESLLLADLSFVSLADFRTAATDTFICCQMNPTVCSELIWFQRRKKISRQSNQAIFVCDKSNFIICDSFMLLLCTFLVTSRSFFGESQSKRRIWDLNYSKFNIQVSVQIVRNFWQIYRHRRFFCAKKLHQQTKKIRNTP